MRRFLVTLLVSASLAAPPLYAGMRYLSVTAWGGGDAVPSAPSPAIPLPALPLAAGAKVTGFGHSYIDRGWATSSTVPGVQILGRGVLPYIDAMERAAARTAGVAGRFDLLACYDEGGSRWTVGSSTRLSCADQGFSNDTIARLSNGIAGVPSTLRRTPYVLGARPQIVYLDIGINDVRKGRTAAQVIADLDRQIGVLTGNGIWVVLQTLSYPKDDFQPIYAATVPQINAWILAQAARPGVVPCDTTAQDGTSAAPVANFTGDLLHISPAGARARAAVLLPLLQTMVAPSTEAALPALDAANLWPLKGLTGTAGTVVNTTGQIASGYNLSRSTGASTYVGSKETIATGNDWQVVTVTPVANGTAIHSVSLRTIAQYSYASLGLAAGDWYEFSLTVKLDDWPGWEVASGDQQTAALYAEGYDSSLTTPYSSYSNLAGMPGRTVRLAIVGKVPAAGDRFRWSTRVVQLFHRSDVAGVGVARIGEPVLRKIADPLARWAP